MIILSYNSNSGKYTLCGNKTFLCDAFQYQPLTEDWIKVQEGSFSKPVVLKLEDCVKPTQKAIIAFTKAIEAYYSN